MDIHTARQQLKTRTIYDLPLRVTFYARVSSESDEQLNSLGNQVSYYEDLISRNINWTYVDGYIDEGLSAATTKNRENFHRMVEDGKAGAFDLMEQKRAWIYCRIAHNGPNSTEVLAAQRHSLGAYAKEHSLEIVGFSNDIGSGLTMDRPGLLDFLAAAKDGKVDILLIHSLTRLGRDMDKVVRYWSLLRDLGISIHTADCGEVDLSPEHTMLCGIIDEMRKCPR